MLTNENYFFTYYGFAFKFSNTILRIIYLQLENFIAITLPLENSIFLLRKLMSIFERMVAMETI